MNRVILALLLGLIVSFSAAGEQKKQLGNWDVHYIAFPSPILTPEVAQQYQLQRSKYNGIVNISVLDKTTQQAQKVAITGSAKDLQSRIRTLEFTEVTEGNAVYYLAQLPFHHEQRYSFTITISSGNQTQQLTFDQVFYVD
ncbi:MAG: DUF4426 domain-containing protein [Gammaproteobacteria bacterium]|nr:DUF4426 domain-containing protein [Gammaproteobacteria bacterium]MBU1555359.1 DUF4426 domain-containing protein [Gammaproteobacteria bacterium]MBU2069859.1 DUF4426 domain-containing protein [Gammaproteobacteria bacterium]MBU2184859.1 DUF4426 domain-containing protein [Gammaproteobacteria bacterium]MBU2204395.1 DUF4426 domain-containing protein [Gammaproteobacteria bacterium]